MQIHDLQPAEGATHRPKKVGRGIGTGHGKTSCRGSKGQKSRSKVSLGFEGGQTPLHRRLPQVRGFKPVNRVEYAVVNVGDLDVVEPETDVTPQTLFELGFLRAPDEPVKVLGDGEITKKLTVHAHKFSRSAVAKLEAAGGAAEVI